MALPVGSDIEVVQRATYKHNGGLYELPQGLRGVVISIDESGDARIDWKLQYGQAAPYSKWLLLNSFSKVRVLNAVSIPGDFSITVVKQYGGSEWETTLGLHVDLPGGTCLYVRELMEEGLIPRHNEHAPVHEQVHPGDLIVDINGVCGESEAMVAELSRSEQLTMTIRRKNSSAALPRLLAGASVAAPWAPAAPGKDEYDTTEAGGMLFTNEVAMPVAIVEPEPEEINGSKSVCACAC